MGKIIRFKRGLSWSLGVLITVIVATIGSTAVLAEDPACVVDGHPISQEELNANSDLCPPKQSEVVAAPAEEPEPPSTEPPTQPTETNNQPPVTSAPEAETEAPPVVTEQSPQTPEASAPTAETAITDTPTSTPDSDAPIENTAPVTDTANPATPIIDSEKDNSSVKVPAQTVKQKPVRHTGKKPQKLLKPMSATPKRSKQEVQKIIRSRVYNVHYQDARTFRENFEPKGRIPEQPHFSIKEIANFTKEAKSSSVKWSSLAAKSWVTANQETSLGRSELKENTLLMADFLNALGRSALVNGLDDQKVQKALQKSVLKDKRITIYDGGRDDIEAGIIDPRLLVTMRFLANRFNTLSISSLVSGHGVYTSSGNISLHAYGQAMDIASLDEEIINASTQAKNGKTWHAVQDILMLPDSIQPKELISLWDMGGASFALSDHNDHIHVGFDREESTNTEK